MFTINQILIHCLGDYVFQSPWMATNKTKCCRPALIHCLIYSLPFFILTEGRQVSAVAVIFATHYIIDRYRLARYIIWLKNGLNPQFSLGQITPTGYPAETPDYLATWLNIIIDNLLHIVINGLALTYL